MQNILGFLLSLLIVAPALGFPLTPDPKKTPGHLCTLGDDDYKERRYPEKIIYCERNVTRARRTKIYDDYGIPEKCRERYTVDHLIPLSIGGSNSDLNLWPEHKLIKADRPTLEQDVFNELREGRISQREAVDIIVRAKTEYRRKLLEAVAKKAACDRPSLSDL